MDSASLPAVLTTESSRLWKEYLPITSYWRCSGIPSARWTKTNRRGPFSELWSKPLVCASSKGFLKREANDEKERTTHVVRWLFFPLLFFLLVFLLVPAFFVMRFSSSTTTCASAALSRLSPSGVFAFSPTQSECTPSNSATRTRITAACGPIF